MKFLFINMLMLLPFVANVKTDCDVCQNTNNVTCHNESQFSICINSIATEYLNTCPKGYVCTADPLICSPASEMKPSCSRPNLCGVCDENKVFACLNETTIEFCFGNVVPMNSVITYCPENTVCDINRLEGYCGNDTLVKPSCFTASKSNTIITTTPSTPRDPNTICKDEGVSGSYKSEEDVTCTKFVQCFTIGPTIQGMTKNCRLGQYFDANKKMCSSNKPEGCP